MVADTVEDTPCIFLGGLHQAERAIAGAFSTLPPANPPGPGSTRTRRCPGWNKGPGSRWRPARADAVRTALASKVSVMTGGPGVGKTDDRQRDPAHPVGQHCCPV